MAGEQQAAAASPALVVVGSISRDRITSASGQTHETAGGAGLYAGLGAVAAGIRPAMAGIVSDDLPGTIIDALSVRADVTGLRRVRGRAGCGSRSPTTRPGMRSTASTTRAPRS